MSIIPPTTLHDLEREAVQDFLDDLAVLAFRYGIVVESGTLAPRGNDVGGYLLLAKSAHLRTYDIGSYGSRLAAKGPHATTGRRSVTMTSSITALTAHAVITRLRRRQ